MATLLFKIDHVWFNADMLTHVKDAPAIDEVTLFFVDGKELRFKGPQRRKALSALQDVTTEIG